MPRPRILILIGRSIQKVSLGTGVKSYVQQHKLDWELVPIHYPKNATSRPSGMGGHFDGLIGFCNEAVEKQLAQELDCPVATFRNRSLGLGRSAFVNMDDEATVVLALQYARAQNYPVFLMPGSKVESGHLFKYGFRHAKALPNMQFASFHAPAASYGEKLRSWIDRFGKPILLFCAQDRVAEHHSQRCLEAGLSVPDEVSILGIDNDSWICTRNAPTLSSVQIPWSLLGYNLALQMHRLLSGSDPLSLTIKPLRIVERESTLEQELDPLLFQSMAWLRQRIQQQPSLTGLAEAMHTSRQTLFRRFKKCIGQSVQEWWLKERLEQATTLLSTGQLPIADIAEQCGFGSRDAFRQVFVDRYGMAPSLFRLTVHEASS